MIGQVRFALINFKRSFVTSIFSSISLIVTYSAIVFSIAMYSIVDPYLYWSVSTTFYKSYSWMGIIFIIVSIIIGGVVTTRSIDLKFQNQKDDIAIMKNVGGKNKWIYSYFFFGQIITAIVMLILGVILALIILAIVFYSLNFGFLFENIRFIPILGANIGILLIAYIKSHYTILRFVTEKNFEVSSGKLSNYKSVFELKGLINKLKTTSKMATKNYIRSGKILASLLFSFFLAFSIISFALGPVSVTDRISRSSSLETVTLITPLEVNLTALLTRLVRMLIILPLSAFILIPPVLSMVSNLRPFSEAISPKSFST